MDQSMQIESERAAGRLRVFELLTGEMGLKMVRKGSEGY